MGTGVSFVLLPPDMSKRTSTSCTGSLTGNVLLSQAVARQVSSALQSLTSVFGMGTGVSSVLLSPDFFLLKFFPSKLNTHVYHFSTPS